MAPVLLDTRPLAEARACSALQALKLNKSGTLLNPIEISSSPPSEVSTPQSSPCSNCNVKGLTGYCWPHRQRKPEIFEDTPKGALYHSKLHPQATCDNCMSFRVKGLCPLCDVYHPCPSCDSPMVDEVCLECAEHTCQRGNFDCIPCQLDLCQQYEARQSRAQTSFDTMDEGSIPDDDDENKENIPPKTRPILTSHFSRDSSVTASLRSRSPTPPQVSRLNPDWNAINDLVPESPTDDVILDLLLPTPPQSPDPSEDLPTDPLAWLDEPVNLQARRERQRTILSNSQPTLTCNNSRARLCQLRGSEVVEHVGSVDTSFSRTLNLDLTGHIKILSMCFSVLERSTASEESAMVMADIISIVSSTLSESTSGKTPIDFVWEIEGADPLLSASLTPGYFALGKCMAIYSNTRRLSSMAGTTPAKIKTSSHATSIDHLLPALTQHATTATKLPSWLLQKVNFLSMCRTIIQEISLSVAPTSGVQLMPSMESTINPRKRKTTSSWDSKSTGTGTPRCELGFENISPTPSLSFKRRRPFQPTQKRCGWRTKDTSS